MVAKSHWYVKPAWMQAISLYISLKNSFTGFYMQLVTIIIIIKRLQQIITLFSLLLIPTITMVIYGYMYNKNYTQFTLTIFEKETTSLVYWLYISLFLSSPA